MRTIFTSVWKSPDKRLILASLSPRRREILSLLGLDYDVVAPSLVSEEAFFGSGAIEDSVATLAVAKAQSVSRIRPQALVLGADTVVVLDNLALGKPKDAADAGRMLGLLSGKTHAVYTGVALVCAEDNFTACTTEKTLVSFRLVEQWEIDQYLEHVEYRDKAGAYAIQGKAMAFIDRIDGCYYNVVGLPVQKTIDLFKAYATRKDAHNV
jgi:septum formation protein